MYTQENEEADVFAALDKANIEVSMDLVGGD